MHEKSSKRKNYTERWKHFGKALYIYIYRRFAALRDKNRYHREGSIAPRASLENFSREIIITVRKQQVPRPCNCGHALIHFRLSDMFTGVLHNVHQLWRYRSVLCGVYAIERKSFFQSDFFSCINCRTDEYRVIQDNCFVQGTIKKKKNVFLKWRSTRQRRLLNIFCKRSRKRKVVQVKNVSFLYTILYWTRVADVSPFRIRRISRCRLSKYVEKAWLINNHVERLEQRYLLWHHWYPPPFPSYIPFWNSVFRGQNTSSRRTGAGSSFRDSLRFT